MKQINLNRSKNSSSSKWEDDIIPINFNLRNTGKSTTEFAEDDIK